MNIVPGDIIYDRNTELVVTYVAIASGYSEKAKRHFEFVVIHVGATPAFLHPEKRDGK